MEAKSTKVARAVARKRVGRLDPGWEKCCKNVRISSLTSCTCHKFQPILRQLRSSKNPFQRRIGSGCGQYHRSRLSCFAFPRVHVSSCLQGPRYRTIIHFLVHGVSLLSRLCLFPVDESARRQARRDKEVPTHRVPTKGGEFPMTKTSALRLWGRPEVRPRAFQLEQL